MKILLVNEADGSVVDELIIKRGPNPDIENLKDDTLYHDSADEVKNDFILAVNLAFRDEQIV